MGQLCRDLSLAATMIMSGSSVAVGDSGLEGFEGSVGVASAGRRQQDIASAGWH